MFGLFEEEAHSRICCKRSTRVPSRHLGLFASCSGTVIGLRISFNSNGQLVYNKYIFRDDLLFMSGSSVALLRGSPICTLIVELSTIVSYVLINSLIRKQFLDINIITIQRIITLPASIFVVNTNVCRAIIATLIDRHCDGGMCGDLFGLISNESVVMR